MRIPSRPVPLGSFTAVMGIAGLGLAWRVAAAHQALPPAIGEGLIAFALAIFVVLLAVWIRRAITAPAELQGEIRLPIAASYLGAPVISTSLLAAGIVSYVRPLGFALWVIAAVGGIAVLIWLLARWIERGINASDITPAFFIPVVGNATTVYASVALGHSEMAWASFSIALICWLTIGPLALYRLLTVEPRLPRRMTPQLGVLISSPAVLASAWFTLEGPDAAFRILAFTALFFALLAARLWRLGWGEPFNVAMWGWTFPVAALAGAFERAAASIPDPLYAIVASIALTIATLVVLLCAMGTVRGWLRLIKPISPPVMSEREPSPPAPHTEAPRVTP